MAVTHYDSGTMFIPIRSGIPCPICGKRDGRCSEFYLRNELLYISCKHEVSDEPSGLPGWYKHYVNRPNNPNNIIEIKKIPDIKTFEISKEVINLRHNVYSDLSSIIRRYIPNGLYEEDQKDLLRRGLSKKEINNMGFFSVPKSSHKVYSDDGSYKIQLATYISKKLYSKYNNDLLKVAGFMKLKGKYGDFVTLKSKMKNSETNQLEDIRGYFIPYRNINSELVGMQYRLSVPIRDDKGKLIRYFWFSSRNASSGSPIDFIVPSSIERDDILLVGEGALKLKIACERLKLLGMAEAGVTNYKRLIRNIQLLEKKKRKKLKIILAFDMDKYSIVQEINGKKFYPILEAEKKTIELLKLTGNEVALAEWDYSKGKGIDDAIQNNAKISYKLI